MEQNGLHRAKILQIGGFVLNNTDANKGEDGKHTG